MKRSKKYVAAKAKVLTQKYALADALKLLPEVSYSKFPGSVEVQIRLKLNDKQKKEQVRGSYNLPHQFGKGVNVLVFAEKGEVKGDAGADKLGGAELIAEVEAGKIDFDVVISTPMMMPKIAKLGKILGTKGLMPNPKNGTIAPPAALEATVKQFKSGMKNFKMRDDLSVAAVIGKTDMPAEKLTENFEAFTKAVLTELKKFGGNVVKSVTMKPTMGPKIEVTL